MGRETKTHDRRRTARASLCLTVSLTGSGMAPKRLSLRYTNGGSPRLVDQGCLPPLEHRHLARSASFDAVDTIARTPSLSPTSMRLCALQDNALPRLSGVIKRMLSLFRWTSQSLRRRPADAPYAARRPEARTTPPD